MSVWQPEDRRLSWGDLGYNDANMYCACVLHEMLETRLAYERDPSPFNLGAYRKALAAAAGETAY